MQKSSKSSKSKSKSRWGDFSEWVWEPEQQFWYRVRQDAEGNLDYDYSTTTQESRQKSEPRSQHAGVDDITEGIRNQTISSNSDASDSEYTVSGSRHTATEKHKSSRSGKEKEHFKDKGKRNEIKTHEHGQESTRRMPYASESEEGQDPNAYIYGTTSGESYPTGDTDYYAQGAGSSSAYQPSAGTYGSYTTDDVGYGGEGIYSGSGLEYGQPAYEPFQDDGGRSTPKASAPAPQELPDASGALDPRYRVERSDRFQPGEIFKAGWAEPKGAANDLPTVLSGKREIEDLRGVTFITGFRRFIVVANDHGHATCVPILSYGGKACTKNGVKPEKHGIIYQRGQRPKMVDREPKLGFPPVKVDITMEGEKLSKESRVNYSKLVTVEHNVKVMFIGSIVPSDWPIVPDAINRCWEQKDHHKRKTHRR